MRWVVGIWIWLCWSDCGYAPVTDAAYILSILPLSHISQYPSTVPTPKEFIISGICNIWFIKYAKFEGANLTYLITVAVCNQCE
ncbi:hypothetical protein B484DRAFT_213947 [Ochromonadaceae sp. CCMP2298]|nr:hypothetical protein B484DRAFT_213947 [Ochromonadaceae sp. CCMP2298]